LRVYEKIIQLSLIWSKLCIICNIISDYPPPVDVYISLRIEHNLYINGHKIS